jgi:hypothetical protein
MDDEIAGNAESPITNCWGRVPLIPIPVEHRILYRGAPGAAYNHHPQVASLGGRLYATWSNGPTHEDEPGQRMLLATSKDGGETWSEPRVLVDRQPGEHGYGVVTSEGIHAHESTLVAYYGYYDYTLYGRQQKYAPQAKGKNVPGPRWHQGTYCGIMVSEDGGETWRGPVARIERFVPNLCPAPLHATWCGRLVMPGNQWFPYTNDPRGIEGWSISGIPGLPDDYWDDPEGLHYGSRYREAAYKCCEGSFYQTDDGALHMMLRTNQPWLAVSESRDGGETWSEPLRTGYSDCRSRFHFGRLPDGRFFGLTCPVAGSARTPLVFATSRDGVVFDRHYLLGDEPAALPRHPGHHKAGRYGYPACQVLGDTVFVLYTISKEDVALCRFSLQALGDNPD